MTVVSWKSQLPFREVKEKVTEAKKAAIEKREHKWEFLLLWRFLLIHYLGPVVIEETSKGWHYNYHHCLVVGLCVSRAGKTKYLGLCFYDYIACLGIMVVAFFPLYEGLGSLAAGTVFALSIMVLIELMGTEQRTQLLFGVRIWLGFDPK